MRKILFFGFLFFLGEAQSQTSQTEWKSHLAQTQNQIKSVLVDFCPADITVDSFKIALIKGTMLLPANAEKRLLPIVKSLNDYGQEVIKKFNLSVDEDDIESDVYYYAGVSPNNPVENNIPVFAASGDAQREAGGGVLDCIVHALGADALILLGTSNTSTWSWPVIKRTFKSIAKKMLGPIGVAIAVVDFGLCMADIL